MKPSDNQNPLLSVKNLTRDFEIEQPMIARVIGKLGGKSSPVLRAIDDISFDLFAGETLGVLGESGSGKSTIARVLMGVYRPHAGTARIHGNDLFSTDRSTRLLNLSRMQMIFQDPFSSLDPRMTIRKILCEPLSIHGVSKVPPWETLLEKTLEEVSLEKSVLEKYPSEFSGGQRQRIGICRALILNPSIIVADEAVSALDVSVQAQILELLCRLKSDRGLSMIFISHDVAVVRQLSDRVIVLYRGEVVESAPVECLLTDVAHPYTVHLVNAALRLREGVVASSPEEKSPASAFSAAACNYYSKCNKRQDRCIAAPQFMELHPGHIVACHFPQWSKLLR